MHSNQLGEQNFSRQPYVRLKYWRLIATVLYIAISHADAIAIFAINAFSASTSSACGRLQRLEACTVFADRVSKSAVRQVRSATADGPRKSRVRGRGWQIVDGCQIFVGFGEEVNKLMFVLRWGRTSVQSLGSRAQQLMLGPRVAHRIVHDRRGTVSNHRLPGCCLEQLVDAGKADRNSHARWRNADANWLWNADRDCRRRRGTLVRRRRGRHLGRAMGGHQGLERRQAVFLGTHCRRPCRHNGCLLSHQRDVVWELALDGRHHGRRDLRSECRGRAGGRSTAGCLDRVHGRRTPGVFQCGTDRRPLAAAVRRKIYLDYIRVVDAQRVCFLQQRYTFLLLINPLNGRDVNWLHFAILV